MTLDIPTLFGTHLDLSPLAGKTRGLVSCPFHTDTTPSFSVDLELGLFHCFSCQAEGGVLAFAALMGEPLSGRRPPVLSPVDKAIRRLYARAELATATRAKWLPWWTGMDALRARYRTVEMLRWTATALGDCPRGWDLATLATCIERDGWLLEYALVDATPWLWKGKYVSGA